MGGYVGTKSLQPIEPIIAYKHSEDKCFLLPWGRGEERPCEARGTCCWYECFLSSHVIDQS